MSGDKDAKGCAIRLPCCGADVCYAQAIQPRRASSGVVACVQMWMVGAAALSHSPVYDPEIPLIRPYPLKVP